MLQVSLCTVRSRTNHRRCNNLRGLSILAFDTNAFVLKRFITQLAIIFNMILKDYFVEDYIEDLDASPRQLFDLACDLRAELYKMLEPYVSKLENICVSIELREYNSNLFCFIGSR